MFSYGLKHTGAPFCPFNFQKVKKRYIQQDIAFKKGPKQTLLFAILNKISSKFFLVSI